MPSKDTRLTLEVVAASTRRDMAISAEILDEASAWAHREGFPTWEPGGFRRPGSHEYDALLGAYRSGNLHLARHDGRFVATVSLLWEDLIYWPKARADGAYVHRLAVRRDAAGRGVGRMLLCWAEERAVRRGRAFLRLDCVAGDAKIRRYYEQAGFLHRGDLWIRGVRMSLYEKPATAGERPKPSRREVRAFSK